MSPMTWRRVEEAQSVRDLTYSGVEHALGWPSGSIRSYLAGGDEPRSVEQAQRPANAPTIYEASWEQLWGEVDRRYRHAIATGAGQETGGPATGLASLAEQESAESVSARGMIPLRPTQAGEDDAASGGQS